MQKYLLDTNSIIYAINQELSLPKAQYLISIITEIELLSYSKLSSQDEQVLKEVLSKFTTVNITNCIKDKTIEIRKNSKIKLPDSIIVASSLCNSAILVTSDKQLLNSGFVKAVEIGELVKK